MPFNLNLDDVVHEVQDLNRGSLRVKYKASPKFFNSVSRTLRPYKALPFQFKPALEKIAEHVRTEMIPEVFEREGPGWAPLSRMTMGRRMAAGFPAAHPILIQTGDLYAELTEKSHPKHIEVIKTGRLARIEIGGSSAKFIENQMGVGRIPARPMIPGTGNIPITDRQRKELRTIAMQELILRVSRIRRAVG